MGVAPSHLGLLRGGATLTSKRQGPLLQGRTVLYATRPKPSAQLIRATRSLCALLGHRYPTSRTKAWTHGLLAVRSTS